MTTTILLSILGVILGLVAIGFMLTAGGMGIFAMISNIRDLSIGYKITSSIITLVAIIVFALSVIHFTSDKFKGIGRVSPTNTEQTISQKSNPDLPVNNTLKLIIGRIMMISVVFGSIGILLSIIGMVIDDVANDNSTYQI